MLTFVITVFVFVSRISTNAIPKSLLEMRAGTTNCSPTPLGLDIKHSLSRNVIKAAVPIALTMSSTNRNSASAADALISLPSQGTPLPAKDFMNHLPLGALAYTELGIGEDAMPMCRILNGMWQVSGAHGYEPEINGVIKEMSHCADEGFTTFDLADIYGPAEEYVGKFCKGRLASSMSKNCQFFTKWVPTPEEITRKQATDAIDRSLRRMSSDRLDLVQFNWFDYKNKYYYDAMDHLMFLKQDGKICNIGLTNFDTEHMADLIDEGAPIVSNQIAYSVIDTRPQKLMEKYCVENNVKMLCYGTLMGGFVSSNWLNKPMPARESLTNVSLRKYLPWIVFWGGWDKFQEMLNVLDVIGKKHAVSISNVAVRWVLDQPGVGGVLVGVRFGLREHLIDNRRVFSFALDDADRAAIAAVQRKSRSLAELFGEPGGEYRNRR